MKKNSYPSIKKERILNSLRIFSVLIITFLSSSIGSAFASKQLPQSKGITLTIDNKTIKEAFSEIEKKTQYVFIYNDKVIDARKRVSFKAQNETIDQVLVKLLVGTGASYKITDRQIIIVNSKEEKKLSGSNETSALTTVSGVVTDESYQPLAGVTVFVKGSSTGTVTDLDGKFILKSVQPNALIVFSYVGYKSQEFIAGKDLLKVTLQDDTKLIDELVVIGYGAVKNGQGS